MKTLLSLILLTASLWGGQSLSGSGSYTMTLTSQSRSNPYRFEMEIHDWSSPGGAWFGWQAFGIASTWSGTIFEVHSAWDSDGLACSVDTAGWSSKRLFVRFQRDTVAGVTGTHYCEIWQDNGDNTATKRNSYGKPFTTAATYVFNNLELYTSQLGSGGGVAFIRLFSTIVPLGSKMPTNADTGAAYSWKFDNNLTATDGGLNMSRFAGASDTYLATPGQTVFPRITARPTVYTDTTTMNAGRSGETLSCALSATQIDAGGTPTCKWAITAGPSAAALEAIQRASSGYTSTTLTLAGAQFGQYTFQVTATDSAGNSASTTADIGFVAVDAQGIIVYPDGAGTAGAAQATLGDSLPIGRSPWGRMDERHKTAFDQLKVGLPNTAYPLTGPVWVTKGAGTVSYYANGIGGPGGPAGTTTTASINSTDLSIPIASATTLELGTLPTWILVGTELVRICSTTATTGAATLTVCGGGRGLGSSSENTPAATRGSGSAVTQLKITGSSTLFKTDTNSPQCPAGVPGPSGPVTYSTGTMTPTASSAVITGSGTNWTTGNGAVVGYIVRMDVKRSTVTTPFWAPILTVDSTTQITLDRPLPAGTDATSVTYQIVSPRYWAVDMLQTNSRVNPMVLKGWGCESETQGFGGTQFDYSSQTAVATAQTGRQYSYMTGIGNYNQYSLAFYSTGLAMMSYYYRSGITLAKSWADAILTQWARSPDITQSGFNLFEGGGGPVGSLIHLAINGEGNLAWTDIRKFLLNQETNLPTCATMDVRENGYALWWLSIGAKYDPDTTPTTGFRARWLAALVAWRTRLASCQDVAGHFASGEYWNSSGPVITLTNGSTAGTGTGIPTPTGGNSLHECHGTAQGTATATNGSATLTAVTGTFLTNVGYPNLGAIILTGTISGATKSIRVPFTWVSGSSVTLGALWPGTTGTVDWMEEQSDYMTTFASSGSDANLVYNYGCIWNSSTSITLHRPWRGSGTSTYNLYSFNVAGKLMQPFMGGILSSAMYNARQLPSVTSGYDAMTTPLSTWEIANGIAVNGGGGTYARVAEWCEPALTATGLFNNLQPGCTYGLKADAIWEGARMLLPEILTSPADGYSLAPTGGNLTSIDTAYANLYCDPVFDVSAPVACDGKGPGMTQFIEGSSMSTSNMGQAKWPGFLFGIGRSYRWPAVRLGGVAAQSLTTKSVKARLADHPLAVSMKMTITWPTGAQTTATCTSGACSLSWDSRQGTTGILTTEYYDGASGTGKRLAAGTQVITGL